jgi:nucleoside-diphosphate-sugar epimerase
MKVLVTGGTGYLGSAIVRALARSGHEPVVFARRATAARLPGVAIDGDVRDRSSIERAARGVEAVCHTAALVSLWRPTASDFDDVNVGGVENVLSVCEARAIRRIAYTSSFLALPPAGASAPLEANDYQRTKVRARESVKAAIGRGLRVVTLSPGVIYGPGAYTEGNLVGRLVRDHLAGQLPGVVGASRIWSFAHVDDVAAAHVRALERGETAGEFALGGENAPQMRAFEIVRELTGRPVPRRIPYAAASAIALVEETRARITGRMPRITRGAVSIFRHDWPMVSRRSETELGYRPRSLEVGLRDVLREAW